MKIRNNRLEGNNGRLVNFVSAKNTGGRLSNGGKPSVLVMHYTAGGSASNTVSFFRRPDAGASAHLVIGRDGDITQMIKFDTVGWHAGRSRWRKKSGVNKFSIGIEIANYGQLSRDANGDWKSWSGQSVARDRVVEKEHKHFPGSIHGWEIFDTPQMQASIDTAKAIVREYDIKPWDLVGHEDISPHRKVDPGPAFGLDKFREVVFGRSEDTWQDNVFEVDSPTGLNLRTAPSIDGRLIENLANGSEVHVIEKLGNWWLVAKVVANHEDTTGYVHKNWLSPTG